MKKSMMIALLCAVVALWACDPNNPIITPANAALPAIDREALASFERELPALLAAHAALDAAPLDLSGTLALFDAGDPVDRAALHALYKRRDLKPLWITTSGALSEDGTSWLAHLRAIPAQHALPAHQLGLPAVERALGALAAAPAPLALEEAERARLITWLAAREASEPLKHHERLVAALRAPDSPVPRVAAWTTAEAARQTLARQRATGAEIALSAALLRYARVMRLDNPAWQRAQTWPEDLMPAADAKPDAALIERRAAYSLEQALAGVFADPRTLDAALITLEPPFPQYARLLQLRARYAAIVAQGGLPTVPRGILEGKPGIKGPATAALRRRLRAEGYLPALPEGAKPQDDNMWDAALTTALASYQTTHQIAPAPKVGEDTLRSLNTPAAHRLKQIGLALARWRATPIGPDQHYIHVNLPDFHAEIWDNGQLKRRFRVVTGSSLEVKDPETGTVSQPRATPEFSGDMKYVVFNPFWNVPKNILDKELRAKIDKDPTFLEKHNYEWYETSPGNRILRQKPGPDNALGVVKFLFPNSHDIYLHDSPDRHLLDKPVRAYSHGCMRVEDPMGLAQYLMEREGRWDAEAVAKWMERPGETWQTLKTPVPVHIDYVMVRVDDEGRPHFLTDVYRRERAQLAQQDALHAADLLAARVTSMTAATPQVAAR